MNEKNIPLKVAFSARQFAGRRDEPSVFEHSLEFVARINQVNYINDSKATSVNDTWTSLNAMTEKTVLILGGIDRRSDYSVLRGLVAEKVYAVVCLGSEREKIFSALIDQGITVHADSMEEAVKCQLFYFPILTALVLRDPLRVFTPRLQQVRFSHEKNNKFFLN